MAKGPSKLIVSIGGELAASFKKTIKQTQASVSGLSKNISREMNNAASASAKGFKNVLRNDAFQASAVGAAAIGTGIMSSVRAAVEFESAMSDVKKVVNFETPDGFKNLQKDIRALAREIPISAAGFAEITAAAGQAGIANSELTRFAESAAKMGVAFDISAGQAGDAMAKFRTAMNLDQNQVEALADSINHLSNNFAATAGETTNFMLRVGALKGQMAISEQSIAAFGSAMIGAGAAPEVAATSFRNLTKALMKGDAATKSQVRAFAALGLSSAQLAKDMQKDAKGTILDVFNRLSKAPAELRNSLSTQLFGSEARALTPLLTNTEMLKKALDSVADSKLFSGSMQAEFEERSKTAANAQQIFKNNLNDLGIVVGSVVLPALTDLMKGLAPIIAGFATFAENNPGLTKGIVILGSAFVGLVAITPFIASMISVFGALKLALIGASAAGTVMGGVIAILTSPITLTIAAIAGLVAGFVLLYTKVDWFKNAVDGTLNFLSGAFTGFFSAIKKGWDATISALTPIFEAFSQTIGGIFQYIQGIFQVFFGVLTGDAQMAKDGVTNIFGGLGNFFEGLVSYIGSIWNLLTGIVGRVVSSIVGYFYELPGKLADVGGNIIDTIKNGFLSRFEALKSVVVESFQKLRDLLPFSDAKKGPFRDLTASGRSIMTTIAKGVTDRGGDLKNAMLSTAETAMDAIAPRKPMALAFAGGPTIGGGSLIPTAPTFGSAGDLIQGDMNMGALKQQTLAPTINITAQTDASADEIGAVVLNTMQQLMDDSEAAQRAGLND